MYGSVMCAASVSILPNWKVVEDFKAPEFVVMPQMAKVMDGQPAMFTCQVSSDEVMHSHHIVYPVLYSNILYSNSLFMHI